MLSIVYSSYCDSGIVTAVSDYSDQLAILLFLITSKAGLR